MIKPFLFLKFDKNYNKNKTNFLSRMNFIERSVILILKKSIRAFIVINLEKRNRFVENQYDLVLI